MALTIRNLLTPTYSANYTYYQWLIWLYREIFELAGWTETYKTADAAWESASNKLLTLTDVAVSSSTPRKITSATGGFVAATHNGMAITLKATNDANKSIFRIVSVEDTNTIWIDSAGLSSAGWTTETGITAEVHNCGQGLLLPTTAGLELVMAAPAASGSSLEAYIKTDTGTNVGDHADIYALPKGDWATTKILTDGKSVDVYYARKRARINVYAEDQNIFIFFYTEDPAATNAQQHFWGELTGVASGDTYPGFVAKDIDWQMKGIGTGLAVFSMLDHLDGTITGYPMWLTSSMSATPPSLDDYIGRRVVNQGVAKVEAPMLYMEDVATGAYIRGTVPILRLTSNDFEIYRPLDGTGTWMHTEKGTAIPRNGTGDPSIVTVAS